jgi:acyl carrier protein phosphodiesterase
VTSFFKWFLVCAEFQAKSVARSLIGFYSSVASTASSTSSSCQTTQGLSSRTPRKEKLQKMLSQQKNKYNELQQQFNILKKKL